MSRWWRAYDEAVDDPKLVFLSDCAHRAWFNLMCLASINDGKLPELRIIRLKLRLSPARLTRVLQELKDAALLDEDESGLRPHNWNGRQYKSDVSTERVKRFRNARRNVTVTPPETETETETERKIKPANAGVDVPREAKVNEPYAFNGGIIRLTKKHFEDWAKSFPALDLRGELTARDAWLGSERATDNDRRNWFISTSKYLANRNLESKSKTAAMRPDKISRPAPIPGVI